VSGPEQRLAELGLTLPAVPTPAGAYVPAVRSGDPVRAEIGDLSLVRRVVKVVGFVASAPDFVDQPGVVNGASELLGDVFGDAGRHARSAVGVAVLPKDVPVEVELVVEVAPVA